MCDREGEGIIMGVCDREGGGIIMAASEWDQECGGIIRGHLCLIGRMEESSGGHLRVMGRVEESSGGVFV